MRTLIAALLLMLPAALGAQSASIHPNFTGNWEYDADATTRASVAAAVSASAIMGEKFVASHDATSLTLKISAGSLNVTAVYKLDGSPSKNMSPGGPGQPDIEVTSRASWDGDKLVVITNSHSPSDAGPVPVESTRVIWIDAEGRLVIDRSGTPKNLVPTTKSIYKKTLEPGSL